MENLGFERTDIKIVNKLFLIGNGFDLALGLKTKYEDFLIWYFKKFVFESWNQRNLSRVNGELRFLAKKDNLLEIYHPSLDQVGQPFFSLVEQIYDLKKFIEILKVNGFVFNINSKIIQKVVDLKINSWVDLEGSYFDILKSVANNHSNDNIIKLNSDLSFLSKLLQDYLSQIDVSVSDEKLTAVKHVSKFLIPIKNGDIIDPVVGVKIKSECYYFLNFNYTKTVSNTLKYLRLEHMSKYGVDLEPKLSQIHGEIDSDEIIFGYGDEIDEDYKKIENLDDNRFFENIKSFKYAKYSEYRNLLRFLNSNDYQVVIYGHSCGLSDRLLLNEVFEHQNCKSIKIFYYNKEEFIQKTMNISRHFKSNQLMRQKIVEFDEGNEIPQIE